MAREYYCTSLSHESQEETLVINEDELKAKKKGLMAELVEDL